MRKSIMCSVMVPCLVALAAPLAAAADAFTLGRYVPADSLIYVHTAHNPKGDFVGKHWDRVFDAVASAGIDQDIKQLILTEVPEQERLQFDQTWDNMMARFKEVRWADLADREMALYVRLTPPEAGVVFRPKPETLQENLAGLKKIFEGMAELSPEVQLQEQAVGGAKVWTLTGGQMPLGLVHKGDLVATVLGAAGPQPFVEMLNGGAGEPIAGSPKLQKALKTLPAPEDSIAFIDARALMGMLKGTMGTLVLSGGETPPQLKLLAAVLEHFDFVDYIASVQRTEGLATLSHTRMHLQEGAATKPMVRAFTVNKPVTETAQYVPAEAKGFWAWSGMDFNLVYDTLLEEVRKNLPDGPQKLAEWEAKQQEMGFNLKKDLLSWLDGRMMTVNLPPAIQTGMSGDDMVLMLKVKDPEKAATNLNGWIDKINAQMMEDGDQLILTPASEVNAEGFRSVTHPAVAMFMLKVTYGVHKDWLVLSNSAPAINKCLETAGGGKEKLFDTPRFRKEGLETAKPPMEVTFTDLSNLAMELSMTLQFAQMPMMFLPPGPQNAAPRALFGILGKLAPAASQMDFMRSYASTSEWTGDGWTTVTKTNYRMYEPEPAGKKDSGGTTDLDGL